MFDRRQRRRTRTAVVTSDHDVVGFGFGHTRSDGADAIFRHQFDGNGRHRIDVFQVVNQLRQILNRVNIVVRRRRNQADTWRGVTQSTDVFGDFTARQLAAFARFRTLRHFDLNLIGAGEVFGGHTETTRRDLFNFRAQRVARFHRDVDQYAVFTNDVANGLAVLNAG